MKILVIPENPTLDQFILKPILERLVSDPRGSVRLEVLRDPHLAGAGDALNSELITTVVRQNPMIDRFILAIDRDCDRERHTQRAASLAAQFPGKMIEIVACEEIETWMLALFDHDESWQDIRAHCDPKEAYADPMLVRRGWVTEVGKGRKRAMRQLSGNWNRLLSRCPELREFQDRFNSMAQ